MTAVRTPKTVKAATALLEQFAMLGWQIDGIEDARNAAIVAANAAADKELEPLLKIRDDLLTKLEPWWFAAEAELTKGKRKSIELGGCMIGSRQGREGLAVAGDEKKAVEALQRRKWALPLLRVSTTLNRQAIFTSLDGVYAKQLKELGFGKAPGQVTFFVERTQQGGTAAGVTA